MSSNKSWPTWYTQWIMIYILTKLKTVCSRKLGGCKAGAFTFKPRQADRCQSSTYLVKSSTTYTCVLCYWVMLFGLIITKKQYFYF